MSIFLWIALIIILVIVVAYISVFVFLLRIGYVFSVHIEEHNTAKMQNILDSFVTLIAAITKVKYKKNITSIEIPSGIDVKYE